MESDQKPIRKCRSAGLCLTTHRPSLLSRFKCGLSEGKKGILRTYSLCFLSEAGDPVQVVWHAGVMHLGFENKDAPGGPDWLFPGKSSPWNTRHDMGGKHIFP